MLKAIWFFLRVCFYGTQVIVTLGFLYLLAANFIDDRPETLYAVVSLGLTVLGVVLAIFGFAGFWMIRVEALEAAKKSCMTHLPDIVLAYFKDSGKEVIRTEVSFALPELLERNQDSVLLDVPNLSGDLQTEYDDIARKLWDNGEEGGEEDDQSV